MTKMELPLHFTLDYLNRDSPVREAIEKLLHFIQVNWTGPCEKEIVEVTEDADKRRTAIEFLTVDGEAPYALVKLPHLLHEAIVSLENAREWWWYARALFRQELLLDNQSQVLAQKIITIIDEHAEREAESFGCQILVEASYMMQFYGKQPEAESLLEKAAHMASFHHVLTGILGRRTKFQTFDVAQLAVSTTSESQTKKGKVDSGNADDGHSANCPDCPQNVELQDEYLLDKPTLNEQGDTTSLGDLEKSILLAECALLLKFYAKDGSIMDKAVALVQKVLETPASWCIYSNALFLRSSLESCKNRLIERAALQMQALVDQLYTPTPGADERLPYVFASMLPAEWEIDRQQGRLFAGLGAFRTAAAIFERRHLWDEYISCLIQLGERTNAEELLNAHLAKDPNNAKFLCLLGDLKEDATLYMRAWQVSNGRCARAMRSLGMYYIRRDQLRLAAECFEKALAVNALFEKIWFLLGCAYLQLEDYHKALHCFSRTVALEPDHSDAWNNLAAVHLHLGQEEEGFRALKEAAKRQYESWPIWHNVFRVALNLGDFMEAISAYRRVAEIREKEVELDGWRMLRSTLQATIKDRGMQHPVVRGAIRQMDSLLEEVMATHLAMSGEFWHECYYYAGAVGRTDDEVEFLFKEYRAISGANAAMELVPYARIVVCLAEMKHLLWSEHVIAHCQTAATTTSQINLEERRQQLKSMVENWLQVGTQNHKETTAYSKLASIQAEL